MVQENAAETSIPEKITDRDVRDLITILRDYPNINDLAIDDPIWDTVMSKYDFEKVLTAAKIFGVKLIKDKDVLAIVGVIKKEHPHIVDLKNDDPIWDSLITRYGFDKTILAAMYCKARISLCDHCNKYKLGKIWKIPSDSLNRQLEIYVEVNRKLFVTGQNKNPGISHSMCPECVAIETTRILKELKEKRTEN
jgi:hypothetical protein